MKAEYDLTKMKSRKKPYAEKLKKPISMRLSEDVVAYFKAMANATGVPHQSLISLYLRLRHDPPDSAYWQAKQQGLNI